MLNANIKSVTNTEGYPNPKKLENDKDSVYNITYSTLNNVISLLNKKGHKSSAKLSIVEKNNTRKILLTDILNDEKNILPFSIIFIEINNFEKISTIFSQSEIEKTKEIIDTSLLRSIDKNNHAIVSYENGRYIIISKKESISSLTRITDNFIKSINGLTIPYPKKSIYSVINVNIGVGYFTDLSNHQSLDNLFDIAVTALHQSRVSGGVVINS